MDNNLEKYIIDCLNNGWTLRDRGTGWRLAEPTKAYTKTHSELIDDEIVNGLEAKGILKITCPYLSLKAELC